MKKSFTWVVEITVDEALVAAGFDMKRSGRLRNHTAATERLRGMTPHHDPRITGRVLKAPPARELRRAQGLLGQQVPYRTPKRLKRKPLEELLYVYEQEFRKRMRSAAGHGCHAVEVFAEMRRARRFFYLLQLGIERREVEPLETAVVLETCKRLGINYSDAAIARFLRGVAE